MFKKIRKHIKVKYPKLYKALTPFWEKYQGALYLIRNIIFIYKPITIYVNDQKIKICPKGHVAKILWTGNFELMERNFIAGVLRPGMRVLNVGANIGMYVLIAGKLVGEGGSVHAFEPSLSNFKRLKYNIGLNGISNCYLNQMALSNFKGNLALVRDPLCPHLDTHYQTLPFSDMRNALEAVGCNTMDSYWKDFCGDKLCKVDMLIIDVEGHELEVLEGCAEVIKASPGLIIMLECTNNLEKINSFLIDCGFYFFKLVSLGELVKVDRITKGNMICLSQKC